MNNNYRQVGGALQELQQQLDSMKTKFEETREIVGYLLDFSGIRKPSNENSTAFVDCPTHGGQNKPVLVDEIYCRFGDFDLRRTERLPKGCIDTLSHGHHVENGRETYVCLKGAELLHFIEPACLGEDRGVAVIHNRTLVPTGKAVIVDYEQGKWESVLKKYHDVFRGE